MIEAPYTLVRIQPPYATVADLRAMPGLVRIELHPPAAGPEVELVFGTETTADPVDEEFLRAEVERVARQPVLAMAIRREVKQ